MSSDDDEGDRMSFGTDNDFEGGKWIDGEFYAMKIKKGRTQSRESQVYGVFDDSSGDEKSFKKRKRSNNQNAAAQSLVDKPVDFVSSNPTESVEITSDHSDDDETTKAFRKLIGRDQSIGPTNNDFRNIFQESIQAPNPTISAKPAVLMKDLGKWEKHTKGFGKKMLEKMGFKGRLGAKENGISAAVEVKVRPAQLGLGFGEFEEVTSLEVPELIASFLPNTFN